jgi:hypothetical protein
MSVYTYKTETGEDDTQLFLTELDIYGASRFGVEQVNQVIASFPDPGYVNINEENGIYSGIFSHYSQTNVKIMYSAIYTPSENVGLLIQN